MCSQLMFHDNLPDTYFVAVRVMLVAVCALLVVVRMIYVHVSMFPILVRMIGVT